MANKPEPLKLTPIKDLKPQLWYVGKLLGMDMYLAVPAGGEKRYNVAVHLLNKVFQTKTVRQDKKHG